VLKLVLTPPDRETLHERIGRRFHEMLAQGFEAEVQRLLDRGDLAPDLPSLRAVGYRQMVAFVLGECDRPTMVERAITATRQYAKRQMTWLRAERDAAWLPEPTPDALREALKMVERAAT
jgi:tRNA dimethylallyltransferase